MDARRTIARLLRSAAAHKAAGDPASAEREYRRAIRRLKVSAATPRGVLRQRARALDALGTTAAESGPVSSGSAPPHSRRSTPTERGFGPDTIEVSTALNNLGVCYKYLGRFLDAGPLYQRALTIANTGSAPITPTSRRSTTTSADSNTRPATGRAASRSRGGRCGSECARSGRVTRWSREI